LIYCLIIWVFVCHFLILNFLVPKPKVGAGLGGVVLFDVLSDSRRKEIQIGVNFVVNGKIVHKLEILTRQAADKVGISYKSADHQLATLVQRLITDLESFIPHHFKAWFASLFCLRVICEKALLKQFAITCWHVDFELL
jgi:hypothetical protein